MRALRAQFFAGFIMERPKLHLLMILCLLVIAMIIQVFVSPQVGISFFVFSLVWLLLSVIDRHLKPWMSPTILGFTFAFTIQAQIHEAIHYFFASIFGAPIDRVEWWFYLQDSELGDPYISINFTGLQPWNVVVTLVAPFLTLSLIFLIFFFIAYKKEPKFTFLIIFPLSLNFVFCSNDVGLNQHVASTMALIVLFLIIFGSFYSYRKRYPREK